MNLWKLTERQSQVFSRNSSAAHDLRQQIWKFISILEIKMSALLDKSLKLSISPTSELYQRRLVWNKRMQQTAKKVNLLNENKRCRVSSSFGLIISFKVLSCRTNIFLCNTETNFQVCWRRSWAAELFLLKTCDCRSVNFPSFHCAVYPTILELVNGFQMWYFSFFMFRQRRAIESWKGEFLSTFRKKRWFFKLPVNSRK